MDSIEYTASIITLGCRANQYESNAIASALAEAGIKIVPSGEKCGVCVVNTCTVTAESDRKSRQMIRRAASFADRVVVTGCFAQIDRGGASSIEGVDLVIGNKNKSAVVGAVIALLRGDTPRDLPEPPDFESCDAVSFPNAERARAYIKIEDGCDNKCAYCVIPKARGAVRSKSRELVLSEAKTLALAGVREIILTGIEIARYGADRGDGYKLIDLIEDVCRTEGIDRVSMGSVDPSLITEDYVSRIALQPKFVRHFHISLQSGCSATLAAMRRKYNADQALETISRLKSAIPDVMISTDIIAGFPGETEAHFNETVEFLRKIAPLHIHSFPYSKRSGTEAASMPDQLPEETKKARNRVLGELNAGINSGLLRDYLEAHRASPVAVLCERIENGTAYGHTEHYVEVAFPADNAAVGEFSSVVTTGLSHGKNSRLLGESVE